MKTALFVDFDNIFIGLRDLDQRAADRFATDPQRWLRWIESGMTTGAAATTNRAVLVRKCYLNPRTFHTFRPYFTRSAFDVVDCPPLTAQGKNSSDIRMVMDILDTLEHPTRFDEFIILSGDADFTPVLLRLRAHDRRTSVLAVGFAAEAYKSASDCVITDDVFVDQALGLNATASAQTELLTASQRDVLLERIIQALVTEVQERGSLRHDGVLSVLKRFREFNPRSNWLGFHAMRSLVEALTARESPLFMVEEGSPDDWQVVLRDTSVEPRVAQAVKSDSRPATGPSSDAGHMSRRVIERVREIVRDSSTAVAMARAASILNSELRREPTDTHWYGYGTFKSLLLAQNDLGIELVSVGPGYLLDPARHEVPGASTANARPLPQAVEVPPPPHAAPLADTVNVEADSLELRVSQITGTPTLSPQTYARMFEAVVQELAHNMYHLATTSEAIHRQLAFAGTEATVAQVRFVLRGIIQGGIPLEYSPVKLGARELGMAFLKNVVTLCTAAQLQLSVAERLTLEVWFTAEIPPRSNSVGERAAPTPDSSERGDRSSE